jgi:hypothetical protein
MTSGIARAIRCQVAVVAVGLVAASAAEAQTRPPIRDICVSVDEARDTLSPQERLAARLLVARQFEVEGWRVVPDGCTDTYTVAHIQLGRRITVTLSGPAGRREGDALGLEDLPALYSQMVRSMVTGLPMTGMNVIDRTNVTAQQAAPPRRTASEAFSYARLGYSTDGPAVGFGHRFEAGAIAVDVSFLSFQGTTGFDAYGSTRRTMAWTWVRLAGLRFRDRDANKSAYYGGGLSWGFRSSWEPPSLSRDGGGLQGDLIAGYEIGRASTIRAFVQTDVTLPFYKLTASPRGSERYAASIAVTVGVGWRPLRR